MLRSTTSITIAATAAVTVTATVADGVIGTHPLIEDFVPNGAGVEIWCQVLAKCGVARQSFCPEARHKLNGDPRLSSALCPARLGQRVHQVASKDRFAVGF